MGKIVLVVFMELLIIASIVFIFTRQNNRYKSMKKKQENIETLFRELIGKMDKEDK